ncbi:MAG: HupE/UreJ family protein [Vicinamibacterales bacterium]
MTAPQANVDVWCRPAISTSSSLIRFNQRRRASQSNPRWGRLGQRSVTVVRLILADGTVRPFEVTGNPGVVDFDPRWFQAAWRFVKLGFEHILDGTDHLLFLFCLVIPFRKLRSLVTIVTAFTVAHSITLIASAYDLGPGRPLVPAAHRDARSRRRSSTWRSRTSSVQACTGVG